MNVYDLPRRDPATLPLSSEPPGHLSAEAAEFWRQTVPHAPWLRHSDGLALGVLAEISARYQRDPAGADEVLAGALIDGLHAFGLTPAGRRALGK